MKPVILLADEPSIVDNDAGFGALSTERGCLPLEALDVDARIESMVAAVTLRQTFVNVLDVPLEATYIFPLPDRYACTGFHMEINERVIEGELQERAAARAAYRQALAEGRRASLAEEERPGVFTLRVGNLMPGERATVRLTMVGTLAHDDGQAEFRFPLVVAPRYIPGIPLPGASVGDGTVPDTDAVPDASRITPPVLLPGFPNPVRLGITVDVHPSPLWNGTVSSSLHAVQAEQRGNVHRLTIQPGERLNRDFILRLGVTASSLRSQLLLQPDADGKQGTFALTMMPSSETLGAGKPREVIFVLDRSGSMEGWKMVAARGAIARIVESLGTRDRFEIVAFDDRVEAFGDSLSQANQANRDRARRFLDTIDARGGTELLSPLRQAVKLLSRQHAESDRILVLVTDGQVGNEDQILNKLGNQLTGLRIFTLGIDEAVNSAFLRRLAALGGGLCELVESQQRLDEVMHRIHRRIGTPILTQLRIETEGVCLVADSLVPAQMPDVFLGTPVVVLGRYKDADTATLTLHARDAAGRDWSQAVEGTATENQALTQVWARGRLRDLEDQYVIAPSDVLEQHLIHLSLKHSVLCRFTAYTAVDRAVIANSTGEMHRIVQPVEMPDGWEMHKEEEEASCSMAPPNAAAMRCSAFYCLDSSDELTDRGSVDASDPSEACDEGTDEHAIAQFKMASLERQGDASAKGGFLERSAEGVQSSMDLGADHANILDAYRQRAADLLDLLEKVRGHGNFLGLLAEHLAELVEDMMTVAPADAEVLKLKSLLVELRNCLTSDAADSAIRDEWTHRALAELAAFADPLCTSGRQRFWA